MESKKIVSLIGVRRSGKMTMLFDLIVTLRTRIDPHSILYVNFEDDRLCGITASDLDNLIEGYFNARLSKRFAYQPKRRRFEEP